MLDKSEQASSNSTDAPILVGVDFSPDSTAALGWALKHAALINTQIVVLHVIHDPAENPGFYNRPGQSALLPVEDVALEKMEAFISAFSDDQKARPQFKEIQTEFVNGLPAGRIAEVAEQIKAQIIVIGTKGRSGLTNLLLGSVAERVLQIAKVPVVVVKAQLSQQGDQKSQSEHARN